MSVCLCVCLSARHCMSVVVCSLALWPVWPVCLPPPLHPSPLDLSLALSALSVGDENKQLFPPYVLYCRLADRRPCPHPHVHTLTPDHVMFKSPISQSGRGRSKRIDLPGVGQSLRTIAVFASSNLTSPRPVQRLPGPTFLPPIGVPDSRLHLHDPCPASQRGGLSDSVNCLSAASLPSQHLSHARQARQAGRGPC